MQYDMTLGQLADVTALATITYTTPEGLSRTRAVPAFGVPAHTLGYTLLTEVAAHAARVVAGTADGPLTVHLALSTPQAAGVFSVDVLDGTFSEPY